MLQIQKVAVYIHIPFCQRKCLYCDFNSYAGGEDLYDPYVEAVCREMAVVADRGQKRGVSYAARTLFFGGGTPTLLAPHHFERMLRAAEDRFAWHGGLETSTEANPGTIGVDSVRTLRAAGINRISLGVQSFDDAMLLRLGRIHDSHKAFDAIDACRRAGIENLNVDLMFGLPEQDVAQWRQTLDRSLSVQVEHLSLYPLTIEENTPFQEMYEAGRLVIPEEDDVAAMYELAEEKLASRYEHYEISNWATKGWGSWDPLVSYRCQHNLVYWRNDPYIGIGAGAHSFLHGERFANVNSPADYIGEVGSQGNAVAFRESISQGLEVGETLMLGLRLSDGVERRAFGLRFGYSLDETLGDLLPRLSQSQLIYDDGEKIALTSRGRLLANEVFAPILERASTSIPLYKPD